MTQTILQSRFRLHDRSTFGTVITSICDWANGLVNRSTCSTFSIETYDREVERYGGKAAIELVESLFCLDSLMVSKLITKKSDRMIEALLSINSLLECFELTIDERCKMFSNQLEPVWRRSVSAIHRDKRKQIEGLNLTLGLENCGPEFLDTAVAINSVKSSMKEHATKLRALSKQGQLTRDLKAVLDDLIHMHCNRFLGIDRSVEWTVRGLLAYSLEAERKRVRALQQLKATA